MPIPTFPAIRPPAGLIWHADDHELTEAREMLWPDLRRDDHDFGMTAAVEAYSMQATQLLNVKVDGYLRKAIDVVASTFNLTRSECTRRLLYAAIGDLPGRGFEAFDEDDAHTVTPAPADWKSTVSADFEDDDDRPAMMGDASLGDDARPEAA